MIANSLRLISVLLVDNYPPIRAGIRNMLSRASDIYVAGESQNGDEARKLLDDLRPSIILLDLVMPGFSPSAFERWIRTHYPETVTLVLTAHDRDTYLSSMADAGVAGFLSKTESINSLITAIRRAASGEVFFSD